MRLCHAIACVALLSMHCFADDTDPASKGAQVNRWAVVVGIKEYQDDRILPLKYADRDAAEFYNLIRTDAGGAFPERQIKKLINEDATTANVIQALRGFLKQADKDDLVLLFFSCHGATDPDAKSKVVSLLTHDTRADDIASSAVPMREIQHSLDEIIRAENVVILIDACHAGGAIKAKSFTRNAGPTPDLLLTELQKAGPGTSFLMSAGPNQQSFEDDAFQHGVFTHFLLKGIKEELADADDDDVIRVGELFDYVKEAVRDHKGEDQVPQLNSEANRNFPLAVTNEQSARTRLEIGETLYELGLELGEKHLLESATRHCERAAKGYAVITGRERQQAKSWMIYGKSRLAVGDASKAATAFSEARRLGGDAADPELPIYLAIAQTKAGNLERAEEAIDVFVTAFRDSGHEKLVWAQSLAAWFNRPRVGRRALLVGVDKPGSDVRQRDVQLMKKTLTDHLQFKSKDIIAIVNEDATYLNLLDAVEALHNESRPDDILFVYFSGDATNDSLVLSGRPMILAYDAMELVTNVPGTKWIVLDTSYVPGPADIADQDPTVNLLWAAGTGVHAYEDWQHGFFTLYLSDVLAGRIGPITGGSVLAGVRERFSSTDLAYHKRGRQWPVFHGDLNAPFLGLENPIDLFDLSQARTFVDDLGPQLAELYTKEIVDNPSIGFSRTHLNLGKYWFRQTYPRSAALALCRRQLQMS